MYEVWCAKCQSPHGHHHHHNHGDASSQDLHRSTSISTTFTKASSSPPGGVQLNRVSSQISGTGSSFDPSADQFDQFGILGLAKFGSTTLQPGKMVWVKSNQAEKGGVGVSSWKRATISSRYQDTLTLIPDSKDETPMAGSSSGILGPVTPYRVTGVENCFPANDEVLPDLTELPHIHEPAILYNIRIRALWKFPYTFIGEVLISVNPLREVSESGLDFLRDPHPKTVAERALRRLRFGIKERKRRLAAMKVGLIGFTLSSQGEKEGKRRRKRTGAASTLDCNGEAGDGSPGRRKKTGVFTLDRKSAHNLFKTLGRTKSLKNLKKKGFAKPKEQGFSDLRVNQAVVISGESGSGKTEAARRVLAQLVDGFEVEDEEFGLQERILASEPILESFGNARTAKNSNSSRFGKFVKVHYTIDEEDYVELRGAAISTYLLEQSRVVKQNPSERNFRVFYNLLSTPNYKYQSTLGFEDACYTFSYINGKYEREPKDEIQYFDLSEALGNAKLGISEEEIYSVVAGILHLSNIKFTSKSSSQGDVAVIVSNDSKGSKSSVSRNPLYNALSWAAKLFGIDASVLKTMILQFTVRVGKEEVVKSRDVIGAKKVVDSIAKKLYSMTFDWLVEKMNKELVETGYTEETIKQTNFVGILDVFGFEIFQKNGFEQLLINYANEVLQIVFTEQVLIGEAELFKSEGIILEEKETPIAQLVAKDSEQRFKAFNTIFKVLDNSMKLPQPSDQKFLRDLRKKLKGNNLFAKTHKKDMNHKFKIKHFAATVEYSIGQFLAKNDDSLPEIGSLFEESQNPLVAELSDQLLEEEIPMPPSPANITQKLSNHFRQNQTKQARLVRGSSGSKSFGSELPKSTVSKRNASPLLRKKSKLMFSRTGGRAAPKKRSVAFIFKTQMNDLTTTLKGCGCSYIRCIKPNSEMTPPGSVKQQKKKNVKVAENLAELFTFYGRKKAEMVVKSRNFYKSGKQISKRINTHAEEVVVDSYFDSEYVAKQLHCLGVFDAVKVLKSGLPTRINFATFISTFKEVIPVTLSSYLKHRVDGDPKGNTNLERSYVAALLYAFDVPRRSYKLGTTKVFFRFGQLDYVSSILNVCEKWNTANRDSFKDASDRTSDVTFVQETGGLPPSLTKEKVLQRFRRYFSRLRWRRAFVKVISQNAFKHLLKRSRAAKVIQRAVRNYIEKQQLMYKRQLDSRAISFQRVWRGYQGRKHAKHLRKEKRKQEKMEALRREKLRQKYIEQKEARSVDAFEKAQTKHRKILTLEKKKLQDKQQRIAEKMREYQERKRIENEQQKEKERKLRELVDEGNQVKEVRRKKQLQKQIELDELNRKIKTNLEKKKSEIAEQQMRSHDFEVEMQDEPVSPIDVDYEEDLADFGEKVKELKELGKELERLEEIEAVINEASDPRQGFNTGVSDLKALLENASAETLMVGKEQSGNNSPHNTDRRPKQRQWKERDAETRNSIYARRMEKDSNKKQSLVQEMREKESDAITSAEAEGKTKGKDSLIRIQARQSNKRVSSSVSMQASHELFTRAVTDQSVEDAEEQANQETAFTVENPENDPFPFQEENLGAEKGVEREEKHSPPNLKKGESLSKLMFKERYQLLEQMVLFVNKKKKEEEPSMCTSFTKAFAQHDEKQRKTNVKKKHFSQGLDFFSSIEVAESEVSVDSESAKEDDNKRKWVSRVRNKVKYKNIKKFPVDKQTRFSDSKMMKKLERFIKPSFLQINCMVFNCRDKDPVKGFNRLQKKGFKKRKVSLQKFCVSPGEIVLYDMKHLKRTIYKELMLDHKVKIVIELHPTSSNVDKTNKQGQKAWRKAKVFVLHVPSGDCIVFEFGNERARDSWNTELRRAQIAFFGNDILGMKTRTKLMASDKKIATGKYELNEVFSALNGKDLKNSTKNPRFGSKRDKRNRRSKKYKARKSQVHSWADEFVQMGQEKKARKPPVMLPIDKETGHFI